MNTLSYGWGGLPDGFRLYGEPGSCQNGAREENNRRILFDLL
jgi:hypothetical protein